MQSYRNFKGPLRRLWWQKIRCADLIDDKILQRSMTFIQSFHPNNRAIQINASVRQTESKAHYVCVFTHFFTSSLSVKNGDFIHSVFCSSCTHIQYPSCQLKLLAICFTLYQTFVSDLHIRPSYQTFVSLK